MNDLANGKGSVRNFRRDAKHLRLYSGITSFGKHHRSKAVDSEEFWFSFLSWAGTLCWEAYNCLFMTNFGDDLSQVSAMLAFVSSSI